MLQANDILYSCYFFPKGKKTELLEKPVPEPRLSASISVSFTPRAFKTAARESKAPEEEEVCYYLLNPLTKSIVMGNYFSV